jgi:arylsulfatase A-like enzyme
MRIGVTMDGSEDSRPPCRAGPWPYNRRVSIEPTSLGAEGPKPRAARVLRALAAVCAACALSGCAPEPKKGEPGILIVILDTVRADHLGSYGYVRKTSPNLDRLAAAGERYENAYAQSPWTLPAVATILTGQPPHVHQASRAKKGLHPVRPAVPNLAERLSRAGFRTAAVMNVIWCNPQSGLARGFERYDYQRSYRSNVRTRDAKSATDAALDWLGKLRGEPFFLVVHYFDAHLTYDPPPPYDTMFEPDGQGHIAKGFGSEDEVRQITDGTLRLSDRQKLSLVARYDGEIRFLDEQFGRLRQGMEKMGLWRQTLVVVVGDHGEEFWDHGGFEHGHTHYRELIRIPLLVRRPGAPGGTVRTERARQIDIAPTVLEFARLPASVELPGQVLGRSSAKLSVAEGSLWSGELTSARTDLGTIIWSRDQDVLQFFGAEDPSEMRNLWPSGPPPGNETVKLLRALPPSRSDEPGEWVLTPEQIDALRSLGYIR